jgi:hypothetical protein
MATVSFSQLPVLGNLTANTIIPVVSANVNYTVTSATLQNFVNGGNGNITSGNITATGTIQGAILSATGNINCGNLNLTGNIVDPASTLQIRSGGNIELVPTTQVNILGPLSSTGNITANNIVGTSLVTGANITTPGQISATGNITGNYLLANIFFATGYSASQIYNGNSQVDIPVANGNVNINVAGSQVVRVTPTGIVSGQNITTTANFVGNLSGTLIGNTVFSNLLGNTVSATGNITGGNLRTTGSITSGAITCGNIIQSPSTSIAALQNLTQYTERCEDLGNSGSSITPDYNNGIVQLFRVNSNFTLNPPLNMVPGRSLTLVLTQDGTGNRAMTANVTYKFAYGIKTLSTAANDTDVLSIFMTQNANATFLCNLVRDYS